MKWAGANRIWHRVRGDPLLPPEWLSYGGFYLSRVLGVAVTTVLAVASARVLQPEGRGEFVAVSASALLGAQILNLGLSSSLLVLFSRRPRRIGRYRRHLLYLTLFWASVIASLGATQALLGPHRAASWWPFWAAWIPLQLLVLYQGAALLALQDAKALSLIELAGRGSAVLLGGACLLAFSDPLRPFLVAIIAADAFTAALGALYLARISPGTPARWWRAGPFIRAALAMGLRAYPPLVFFFLLIKSDLLVLRMLRGAAETGVYSIASQIVDMALMLPTTIAALMLASVARSDRPTSELLRVLRPTALLTVGLALALLAVGRWGIVLLFGRLFEGAYPALVLLLPGFVFMGLLSLLGQYFATRGFPLFLTFYWLTGFAVNLALNLALVPRFGMLAAASSSSVSYALVFFLMVRRFRSDRRVEMLR